MKKKKTPKRRDLNQFAIARREAQGMTRVVPSKKRYKRKPKHPKKEAEE